MSRTASGVYGGVSADDRRAERRRRLMDAAFALLGTEGWSATTVRGVCAEAKLTPRFFYESFEDLDALAVAVFDDIVETATARVLEALASAPPTPQDAIRAAIEAFVFDLTDDPRRARIVFVEALGSEPLLRRRLEVMRSYGQLFAEQARIAYRPPPEAEGLVEVTAAVFAGGMAELLITWTQGGLRHTREELVDDCVALFTAGGDAAARLARQRAAGRLS
jgi:AcrR family transcriptional regulator